MSKELTDRVRITKDGAESVVIRESLPVWEKLGWAEATDNEVVPSTESKFDVLPVAAEQTSEVQVIPELDVPSDSLNLGTPPSHSAFGN